MDRFEKLLGKKTQQSGAGESPEQPSAPATSAETAPTSPGRDVTAPNGFFGLKFVLDNGETRMFTTLPITIGRAEDNTLVIKDEAVSAHHAVVLYDDRVKEICLVDLESLNGVMVNDQPTLKNVLTDGARIGLGKTHLVFRDTGYIHSA